MSHPAFRRITAYARRVHRAKKLLVYAFVTTAVAASAAPPTGRAALPIGVRAGTATPTTYVIGVAGDIACASDPYPSSSHDNCQYDDTSNLVVHQGLTEILTVGDNQYDTGAYGDYRNYFDPWWGRAKANIDPVPGNHEYAQDPSSKPRGYFRYFGDRVKGPDGLGYYSYDLPTGCTPGKGVCWHFVALSSELCFASGGCGPASDPASPGTGNQMYAWLKSDLAGHPQSQYACTLAYWHHPLFSFSTGSGATAAVKPLWDLLFAANADLVLNGHSHNYQRWKPQDPDGTVDADHGIREFVIGTGGASKYALPSGSQPANLVTAQDSSFGILKLTLRSAGYTWEWVTASGQPSFTDSKTTSVKCA